MTGHVCHTCLWWIPGAADVGACQLALDAGHAADRGAGMTCAAWRDVESEG